MSLVIIVIIIIIIIIICLSSLRWKIRYSLECFFFTFRASRIYTIYMCIFAAQTRLRTIESRKKTLLVCSYSILTLFCVCARARQVTFIQLNIMYIWHSFVLIRARALRKRTHAQFANILFHFIFRGIKYWINFVSVSERDIIIERYNYATIILYTTYFLGFSQPFPFSKCIFYRAFNARVCNAQHARTRPHSERILSTISVSLPSFFAK